jgi:HAD superfamily hydrolase (TIGR01509 family)
VSTLQAVLCDMDGTLVDTEPYWEVAKLDLAAHHGVPFTTDDTDALVGRSMMITVQAMRNAGVPLEEAEVLAELVEDVAARVHDHIPWLPGAQEFLARMAEEGIPLALVTQAWEPVARQILDASNGVLQVLVSGADVTHPKPHPEPYQLAAQRLGVDVRQCVAIEDSPAGVESAERAGVPVLVLPGVHPVEAGPNRHTIASLDEVDRPFLEQILATR